MTNLRTDLRQLAQRLLALSDEETSDLDFDLERASMRNAKPWIGERGADTKGLLAMAERDLGRRKARAELMPDGLAGEGVWTMLLDLYVRDRQSKQTSITSACLGAHAPTTTALRYLTLLVDERLIARRGDAGDQRRTFVHLTPKGIELVEAVLRAHLRIESRLAPPSEGADR